jgi:isopenicillin N synthase-like dioxygenase
MPAALSSLISTFNLAENIFKSTVHRAVNRNGVDRSSIPLFLGADSEVNIEVRISLLPEHRKTEVLGGPVQVAYLPSVPRGMNP